MEKIVEVEVVKEIIKEVEKIVYKDRGSDDCMSEDRFIQIWNKLFTVNGVGSNQCLGEGEFVNLVARSIQNNANDMTHSHKTYQTLPASTTYTPSSTIGHTYTTREPSHTQYVTRDHNTSLTRDHNTSLTREPSTTYVRRNSDNSPNHSTKRIVHS